VRKHVWLAEKHGWHTRVKKRDLPRLTRWRSVQSESQSKNSLAEPLLSTVTPWKPLDFPHALRTNKSLRRSNEHATHAIRRSSRWRITKGSTNARKKRPLAEVPNPVLPGDKLTARPKVHSRVLWESRGEFEPLVHVTAARDQFAFRPSPQWSKRAESVNLQFKVEVVVIQGPQDVRRRTRH
jgi:hypothetical protein